MKKNITKSNTTAIEAAEKLINEQKQKDVNDCVNELQALQEQENVILKKYNCSKNLKGEFLNNQIQAGFVIAKN